MKFKGKQSSIKKKKKMNQIDYERSRGTIKLVGKRQNIWKKNKNWQLFSVFLQNQAYQLLS